MVNKLIKMGTGDYALIQLFICILTESSRYIGSDINILDNPVNNEYRNYEYDNIGNRKYATDWDNTNMKQRLTNYYANSLNQYTQTVQSSIAKDNFTYDEDGNLTSISSGDLITKYTYNAENRLIAVEPENPTNGDKKLQFKYDYMGRRVLKQIYTLNNGNWELKTEKLFVYNGWNMFCQINVDIEDETQNPKEDYFVWGLDLSHSLQGAGGVGGLIAWFDSSTSTVYYYHYDGNGNVGQLVDSQDGKIAAHYEYDPFGNIIVADGLLSNRNVYRFSTKYFDVETGLVYYGYRYYKAEIGRWITRDPLREKGGINYYVFNFNYSVNSLDPNGLLSMFGNLFSPINFAGKDINPINKEIQSWKSKLNKKFKTIHVQVAPFLNYLIKAAAEGNIGFTFVSSQIPFGPGGIASLKFTGTIGGKNVNCFDNKSKSIKKQGMFSGFFSVTADVGVGLADGSGWGGAIEQPSDNKCTPCMTKIGSIGDLIFKLFAYAAFGSGKFISLKKEIGNCSAKNGCIFNFLYNNVDLEIGHGLQGARIAIVGSGEEKVTVSKYDKHW